MPVHRTKEGLPIGVQLAAAKGREDLLLQIAEWFEQEQIITSNKTVERSESVLETEALFKPFELKKGVTLDNRICAFSNGDELFNERRSYYRG